MLCSGLPSQFNCLFRFVYSPINPTLCSPMIPVGAVPPDECPPHCGESGQPSIIWRGGQRIAPPRSPARRTDLVRRRIHGGERDKERRKETLHLHLRDRRKSRSNMHATGIQNIHAVLCTRDRTIRMI
jgi:hypothetical protein